MIQLFFKSIFRESRQEILLLKENGIFKISNDDRLLSFVIFSYLRIDILLFYPLWIFECNLKQESCFFKLDFQKKDND